MNWTDVFIPDVVAQVGLVSLFVPILLFIASAGLFGLYLINSRNGGLILFVSAGGIFVWAALVVLLNGQGGVIVMALPIICSIFMAIALLVAFAKARAQ